MLDILIRGADLIDGSGATRRRADVGIRDGRVWAIGEVDESAARTIDATGLVVAPGFVDVHTHLDAQAFWDPTLSPSPLHGVTTVVGGNCGFTIAPLDDDSADYLMRMLARVEGMPLESLQIGVPWNWRSTAEYFDRLDGTLAINAGFMIGHSTIRRVAMGTAALERAATDGELDAMCELLRRGLAAGGMGFSSSWGPTHNDADGHPVPSRFATADELVVLSGVCREFPGTSLEFIPYSGGPFRTEHLDLMARMSAAARRALNWNAMVPTAANVDECMANLHAGTYAAERGGKVVALTIPMVVPVRLSFLNPFILEAFPGWGEAMALPAVERLRLLRSPTERQRLLELSEQPNPLRRFASWSTHVITETFTPDMACYQGRSVGDIAAHEGKAPFDALMDIVCAEGLRTGFTEGLPAETVDDWKARLAVWRDGRAVVGASDAGAHVDMIGSFNYTTQLLQGAVRQHQVLDLEEAVHLLTDVPARLYGLVDRGRLYEGAVADIVVLDESTVGSEPLRTRHDLPGGCGRLYAEATGIHRVLVNGVEISVDGRFTGRRPGTLLRSGRDSHTAPLG